MVRVPAVAHGRGPIRVRQYFLRKRPAVYTGNIEGKSSPTQPPQDPFSHMGKLSALPRTDSDETWTDSRDQSVV